jgi:hypothetical protein
MHDIGSRSPDVVELFAVDRESFANCCEARNTPLSTNAVQIRIPTNTVETYLCPFFLIFTEPQ